MAEAATISDAAKAICGQYFPTPESVIRSSPPHETLGKMRAAMDELIAAGLVTERPFNAHGVLVITGSVQAAQICRAHRMAVLSKCLG